MCDTLVYKNRICKGQILQTIWHGPSMAPASLSMEWFHRPWGPIGQRIWKWVGLKFILFSRFFPPIYTFWWNCPSIIHQVLIFYFILLHIFMLFAVIRKEIIPSLWLNQLILRLIIYIKIHLQLSNERKVRVRHFVYFVLKPFIAYTLRTNCSSPRGWKSGLTIASVDLPWPDPGVCRGNSLHWRRICMSIDKERSVFAARTV